MPTRNVVLTERHEKLIADPVSSGRYQNASEILRDGLRLVEERDAREAAKLQALREAAQSGINDIERGKASDSRQAVIPAKAGIFFGLAPQKEDSRFRGNDELACQS